MNTQQALNVLIQATAQLKLSREEHNVIGQALNVIGNALAKEANDNQSVNQKDN